MWYSVVLVLLPGALCQYIYTDSEGYTRSSSSWGISVTGAPWLLESHSYPLAAPRVKQTWGFMVTTPKGMTGGLKVTCNDLRIPETNSCKNFSLTIRDGTKESKVCGDKKDYTFTSRGNNVVIEILSEVAGKVYMSCVAKGILLDGNKNEIVGATALPPPSTRPPPTYLTAKSEEVDSAEHGVGPGERGTSCKCGWANKQPQERIVNGVEARVNEFPFMVLLVTQKWKQPSCGGTIISALHVLTAAHCTQKHTLANTPLGVIVGLHHTWNWAKSNGTEMYNVKKSIEHEKYNNVTFVYDISLMFLERRIVFHPSVGPTCMPTGQLDLAGQYVRTIGWGALKHKGFMVQELRKADVRVLPLQDCYDYASRNVDLSSPHQLCVFSKDKGFCMGDSGGPIVWLDPETNRYTLVGAPSFVITCGSTIPSVAVDVSSFLPWIKQKMTETSTQAKTCSKI